MRQPYRHEVFLSYAREDTAIMQVLRDEIKAAGLSVWTDEAIHPGTPDWQTALERAIKEAACVVVVLSPDARESDWVRIELNYAHGHEKTIFPVLARGDDDDAVPLMLSLAQRIDLRQRATRPLEIKRLVRAIHRHISTLEYGPVWSQQTDTKRRTASVNVEWERPASEAFTQTVPTATAEQYAQFLNQGASEAKTLLERPRPLPYPPPQKRFRRGWVVLLLLLVLCSGALALSFVMSDQAGDAHHGPPASESEAAEQEQQLSQAPTLAPSPLPRTDPPTADGPAIEVLPPPDVRLTYSEKRFKLVNVGPHDIDISDWVFVGDAAGEFHARLWGSYTEMGRRIEEFAPEGCLYITRDAATPVNPCRHYGYWLLQPYAGSQFWTAANGNRHFFVTLASQPGAVLATCTVTAGRCEFVVE